MAHGFSNCALPLGTTTVSKTWCSPHRPNVCLRTIDADRLQSADVPPAQPPGRPEKATEVNGAWAWYIPHCHGVVTYIRNCLQSVNIVDLSGDQLPYGSLNLHFVLTHGLAVDKVSPRSIHVLQILQRVRERGMVKAKRTCSLGHSILCIAVKQLVQLTLLWILYTEYGRPTLSYLLTWCGGQFACFFCRCRR